MRLFVGAVTLVLTVLILSVILTAAVVHSGVYEPLRTLGL